MAQASVVGPLIVGALAAAPALVLRYWRHNPAIERASRIWIVAVATLTTAEVATRLIAKRTVTFETQLSGTGYAEYRPGRIALGPNRQLLWGTRNRSVPPVEVRTNADGLRVGAALAADAGPRRVLFAGDSFTFGVGLEAPDTMPAQAAALLGARPGGQRWAALNAGVPGYNVWSSIERVEFLLPRYRPTAVVVTMGTVDFRRSDINDDARRFEQGWLLQRSWALRLLRFGNLAVRYHYPAMRWNGTESNRFEDSISGVAARLAQVTRGVPTVLNVLYYDLPCDGWRVGPFRDRGIVVNCTPWEPRNPRQVIPGDGHPNVAGARLLAEHAVNSLAFAGVVPTGSTAGR